ncbi:hypothetical protein HYC85_029595 [Camellia sinensis]|uniref:Uncharacterized protein n=1 Tax=Camellia sinensis TaxID=4442 RepID=A0A7J7G2B8_CAMSI|nr:hypothetical protein HYC85_029595 [Camellia sinensis]
MDWTLKGDKNTRLFPVMANMRQGRNMINSMNVGESSVKEPTQIKKAVCNYFKSHFDEKWSFRPSFGGPFKGMDQIQAKELLEQEFTEAEVLEAIRKLLQLSTEEEISLSAILSRGDLSNEWDFNFIRALHAWEESEVLRLTVLLGTSPSLQLEQGDSMRWKANQTGVYKSPSFANQKIIITKNK